MISAFPRAYRIAIAIVVDAGLNIGLLMITYPIWREFKYKRYPAQHWWRTYVWAGILCTIIVLAATAAVALILKRRRRVRMITLQMISVFLLLATLAVFADFSEPVPASTWPDLVQDIAAKFFAELQSTRFVALTASSMALVSGALFAWVLPRYRQGVR